MPGTLARMSSRFSIASVSSIISMTSTSPSGSSGQTSALLGVIALYSPKHTHDPLFLSNYVTINLLDQIKSTFGVGDATLWGPQDYSMRVWVRTDQLTGLGLTSGDIINAIKAQNVQAAVGRVGARSTASARHLRRTTRRPIPRRQLRRNESALQQAIWLCILLRMILPESLSTFSGPDTTTVERPSKGDAEP